MMKKIILSICLCIFIVGSLFAQNIPSYLYIQGDKEIPFYVKLEGKMMPRYSKNYSIVGQLEPGLVNIEILFEKSKYQPVDFVVKIPANGFREFLLIKKDSTFALYDLAQKYYLQDGNTEADDKVPYFSSSSSTHEAVNNAALVPVNIKPATPTGQPVFINTEVPHYNSTPMVNTNCKYVIDDNSFNGLNQTIKGAATDEERILYLAKVNDGCFTTAQMGALLADFQEDPPKFTFIKSEINKIADPSALPDLAGAFKNAGWRNSYLQLIQTK